MIYLDNASTTSCARVFEEIKPFFTEYYGNPGSKNLFGVAVKNYVEIARQKVANMFEGYPQNIIFTSSGSEANTLAIVGLSDYLKSIKKTHIITTKYEHHSVLNAFKHLELNGFDVTYLNLVDGHVTPEMFAAEIRSDTGLASIMYVNNETGAVNNVDALSKTAKEKGVIFHSDCVQAAGYYDLSARKLSYVDMMTVSGHKIHAPKGSACLFVRDRTTLSNVIFGGDQEQKLRPGTENVPAIVGFGAAAEMVNPKDTQRIISYLNRKFVNAFHDATDGELKYKYTIMAGDLYAEKIISLTINGVDAASLLLAIGNDGVMASAGSACSSNMAKPSHALLAYGLTTQEAFQTIRISFSDETTPLEVKEAAEIIAENAKEILKLNK